MPDDHYQCKLLLDVTDLVDLHEDESVRVVIHEAGHPALPGLTNEMKVLGVLTNEM